MSWKKISKQAKDFMKQRKYQKGSYSELQQTTIWANAKKKLLDQMAHNGKIKCSHCRRDIFINRETAVLHHKKYVWSDLFNPKYIAFLHNDCHQRVHRIKEKYRKVFREG